MTTSASSQSIAIYTSEAHACSYLDQRSAHSHIAHPSHAVGPSVYAALITQGFRRSGAITYRPACKDCQACIPLRIAVDTFAPKRSQRRAWQAHQHLTAHAKPLKFDPEHYALYCRYQEHRHPGGALDHGSAQDYSNFLLTSHVHTQLIEFRAPVQDGEPLGALKMVSIIDVLPDGLSAVYTFYDPADPQSSYGTYNVLWQIQAARQQSLPYCYLGYWISASPKMAYKAQFQPFEILVNGRWQAGC
jgi:leucyl-tRNA---protein transferase